MKDTIDSKFHEVETSPTFLAIGFEDRDQFDNTAAVDADGINLLLYLSGIQSIQNQIVFLNN